MSATLVIDTHILIWMRSKPHELRDAERSILASSDRRCISIVSLWELATLIRLGRISQRQDWLAVPESFDLISVSPIHCGEMASLPLHHRDPFDRMLVAQAKTERLGIMTRDQRVLRYGRERDGLLIPD
jgi:PIN domain nuclease of toxin-antitoxin system